MFNSNDTSESRKIKVEGKKNKNLYEEILEKTTKSIEEFIQKTDIEQEKNIQ